MKESFNGMEAIFTRISGSSSLFFFSKRVTFKHLKNVLIKKITFNIIQI